MPPHFDVADPARRGVGAALAIDPANRMNRSSHYLHLIGRLAGGVFASAQAELDTLLSRAGRARSLCRRRWRPTGPHTPDTKNRITAAPRFATDTDCRQRADAVFRAAGAVTDVRAADRVRQPRQPAPRAPKMRHRSSRPQRAGRQLAARCTSVHGRCLLQPFSGRRSAGVAGVAGVGADRGVPGRTALRRRRARSRRLDLPLARNRAGDRRRVQLAPLLHLAPDIARALKEGSLETTTGAGRNRVRRRRSRRKCALENRARHRRRTTGR